jgi:nucleoside-diphosphate-sugar epimerase
MRFLIIGAGSHLGQDFIRICKEKNIEIWSTQRIEVNEFHKYHDQDSRIFVDKKGNLISDDLKIPHFDCAFFFATHYSKSNLDYLEIINCNVVFSLNILINLLSKFSSVIYANSFLALENPSAKKKSLYAETKSTFSKYLISICQEANLRHVNLYLYDIYGNNDKRSKLLDILLKAIEKDEILRMTDGTQLIFPTYIEDVVRILLDVGQNKSIRGSFQIRNPEPTTIRQFVGIFQEIWEVNLRIEWGALPFYGDELFSVLDNPKLLHPKNGYTSLRDFLNYRKLEHQ